MSAPDIEEKALYIEIWKKAVETQMHFNEMSVKSRQLGLTFVAASLGLGVVLLTQHKDYSLPVAIGSFRCQIDIALLLLAGAALALRAVRQLDLEVYHKMLRGAVAFGEDFEENYMKRIFQLEKGMTQAISHFSRCEGATAKAPKGSTKAVYQGSTPTFASDKITRFYTFANRFLWAAVVGLFLITNLPIWFPPRSEPKNQTHSPAAAKVLQEPPAVPANAAVPSGGGDAKAIQDVSVPSPDKGRSPVDQKSPSRDAKP